MLENPETGPTDPPRPLPSGTARLQRRRAKKNDVGVKARWIILAIILLFFIGLILSGEGRSFIRYLYSPVAIIIIIFAIIEYIVLKGRDRSRIYRMEIEKAREKRRLDQAFLNQIADEIGHIANLLSSPGCPPDPEDPQQKESLAQAQAKLAILRNRIRSRL